MSDHQHRRVSNANATLWTYRCDIVRVVDGDTLDLRVDLGFRVETNVRARLRRVDTPEPRGADREQGREATDVVRRWITDRADLPEANWSYRVRTEKTGKYGRWLAEVTHARTGSSLNDVLISHGWGLEP